MRKWFVWLVVPALLAGACNQGSDAPSGEEDPTGALIAAFEETGQAEQQTVTITLESTPESLVAAAEGGLPTEAADIILGSSLTITAQQGEDPADQAARLVLNVPNTEGVELIFLGTDLYLRSDVRGLLEAFGQDPALVDQFLQSPTAQQAAFLEPAVNGEFIQIQGTEALTGGTGTEQIAAQQEQVLQEFEDAIRDVATVEFEGEDDAGEHYVVSAPLRDLVQRFVELASELGTAVPPPSEGDIPEGDVTVDFWVSDDRISQLEVDIVQNAQEFGGEVPEGVEEMVVRLAFSYESEEITAPEGAVTVTAEEIMGLIFGGLGGGGLPGGDLPTEEPADDLGGGGGDICSVYEELPPETFEGLPPSEIQQIEQLCPGITQ